MTSTLDTSTTTTTRPANGRVGVALLFTFVLAVLGTQLLATTSAEAGTTTAGDITINHDATQCTTTGGKYAQGSIHFRVRVYERGQPLTADRAYIYVWASHWTKRVDGQWNSRPTYTPIGGRYLDRQYGEWMAGGSMIRQFLDDGGVWFKTKVPRGGEDATGYHARVYVHRANGGWDSWDVAGGYCYR